MLVASPMHCQTGYSANLFPSFVTVNQLPLPLPLLWAFDGHDSARNDFVTLGMIDMIGAVLRGRIYVMGGFDGSELLDSVESFDPREGTWRREAPLLT
jgi:hypothetical protein